jgi:hypothetical protein
MIAAEPRCRALETIVALVVVALVVVGVPASSVLATSAPTVDAPVDGGDVSVVDYYAPEDELAGGVSSTVFTLTVPDGAVCPGDSANDQWRLQSFIVPATVDPAELTFGGNDPVGDGNWSLYRASTSPFVDELTEPNTAAGQPGRISSTPALSFAVFPPTTLPDGEYRIGLACTLLRQPAIFWDTRLEVVSDPRDEPGQMRWSILDAPATAKVAIAASDPRVFPRVMLAVSLVVLAATGVISWRWRTDALKRASLTSNSTLTKESS